MKPTEITIDGMHCDACVQRVQKALKKIPGAFADKVEVGKALVQIPPGQEPAVLAALEDMGFEARLAQR